MQGGSTIKYYRNTTVPRHITCLPSYRHEAFPTQISRKLLIYPLRTGLFATETAFMQLGLQSTALKPH